MDHMVVLEPVSHAVVFVSDCKGRIQTERGSRQVLHCSPVRDNAIATTDFYPKYRTFSGKVFEHFGDLLVELNNSAGLGLNEIMHRASTMIIMYLMQLRRFSAFTSSKLQASSVTFTSIYSRQ
jgi:hypothetical protein